MTTVFAASLWIPYIVGVNMHPQAGVDDFARPPAPTGFPAWVHRARRAFNLIEQALTFAIVVLIAHNPGISTTPTVWASALFF